MSPRISALIFGIGAAASLGACASVSAPGAPPLTSSADRHAIQVAQAGAQLELDAPANARELTGKARSDIAAFAGAYLRAGHGGADGAVATSEEFVMAMIATACWRDTLGKSSRNSSNE